MSVNDSEKTYENIASEFTDKYCRSFKGEVLQEEVTQPFWYSMFLERQRLKDLGIRKSIQIKENQDDTVAGGLGTVKPAKHIETTYTAGNKVTLIKKPVGVRKTYTVNGGKKKVSTDYCQCAQCVVMEGDRKKNEYVCPYCGAIGISESFIDGCDYCGAKFKVTDLGRKVSSFNVFHDYDEDIKEKEKIYKIAAVFVGLVSMLLFFISFVAFDMSDILAGEVMLKQLSKVATGVGIGIFLSVVYGRMRLKNNSSRRLVENDQLKNMEASIAGFNREEFITSLDYKLKTLHFARTSEEIKGFYKDGCEKYVKLYENIIECNLKSCLIKEYKADDRFHYINTEVLLDIVCLENNKLVTRQEKMYVSLYKSVVEKESSSIVSYSCDSCGSSISLLNGGKCLHCGKQLDLSLYDFAVADIKSQWETQGNKGKKNQEKFLKRLTAVVSIAIICLNIPRICGAVNAGIMGLKNDSYSVYMTGNDIVPSFSYYGYALLGSSSVKGFKTIYTYKYVNDFENNINDYADKLVSDDGFRILERDRDIIKLRRKKKFGLGNINLTIQKTDNRYEISIE